MLFTLTNLKLSRFLSLKSTCVWFLIILGSFNLLSTCDFVGNFIIVFGNVKVELRIIENCSFNFHQGLISIMINHLHLQIWLDRHKFSVLVVLQVHFYRVNIIEISINKVNMIGVFYYTRIVKFIININFATSFSYAIRIR